MRPHRSIARSRAWHLFGHRDQHRVARGMPVPVVDAFEAIEVDHQHRQGPPAARGAAQLLLQLGEQVAPVGEAGQRVGRGEAGELLLVRADRPQQAIQPDHAEGDQRRYEEREQCVGKICRAVAKFEERLDTALDHQQQGERQRDPRIAKGSTVRHRAQRQQRGTQLQQGRNSEGEDDEIAHALPFCDSSSRLAEKKPRPFDRGEAVSSRRRRMKIQGEVAVASKRTGAGSAIPRRTGSNRSVRRHRR